MDGGRRIRILGPDRWLAAGVGLVALLVYANSLPNGFALDDGPILQRNHQILNLANLPRFFEQDYFEPSRRMGLYRPLVISSYALTVAVAGTGPFAFHLTNVLFHAANSILLFLLFLRLTQSRPLAAGAAVLFAAHAVHTEAVANISFGRPELMAAFFGLIALHAWRSAEPDDGPHRGLARAVSLAAFGLAILCKESAVSLIAVVVLMDWVYPAAPAPVSARGLVAGLGQRKGDLAGWCLVIAACVGLRLAALGDMPTPPVPFVDNPLGELPDGWRVLNGLLVGLRYGGLFLFPVQLVSDYSFDSIPIVGSFADPTLWLGLCLLLGLAGLAAWSRRRDRDVFFGLGFAAISFLPASNLLMPIGTILGERLLYFPSAGLSLGAIALLLRGTAHLPGTPARRNAVFAAILAVLTGLHAVRAVTRNPVWANDEVLRFHDLALNPESVKLQSNAGASHLDRGEARQALARFDLALRPEITPERFLNPYQGKVTALVELGRFAEARQLYEIVILHGPSNPEIERRIANGLDR